jgi:hypothetical protein
MELTALHYHIGAAGAIARALLAHGLISNDGLGLRNHELH